MAFTEDFSEFLDSEDFAVEATINGGTVLGILDRDYVEVGNVEGEYPLFQCAQGEVDTVTHGTTLTTGGVTYTVVGIQPDGTGMVALVLQE